MKKLNLLGETFGRLTVIAEAPSYGSPSGRKRTKWKVKCSCGTTKEVLTEDLKNGSTISCGCYSREQASKRAKHGHNTKKEGPSLIGLWICAVIAESLYFPIRQLPGIFIPPSFLAWYIFLVWQDLLWWRFLLLTLAIWFSFGWVYASLQRRFFLKSYSKLFDDAIFLVLNIFLVSWSAGL